MGGLRQYEYDNKIYLLDGSKIWMYDGDTIAEVECPKPDFLREGE